jgi:F-type H+-transporting ATPase subunit epsilon
MVLDLVTPYRKVILDFEINDVTLPGTQGNMQILPKHTNLVSTLRTGLVHFTSPKDNQNYIGVISYGFVEVWNEKVTILANTFELSNEIDTERAEKALKTASQKLQTNLDEENFKKYSLKLERALIRLQAARR